MRCCWLLPPPAPNLLPPRHPPAVAHYKRRLFGGVDGMLSFGGELVKMPARGAGCGRVGVRERFRARFRPFMTGPEFATRLIIQAYDQRRSFPVSFGQIPKLGRSTFPDRFAR